MADEKIGRSAANDKSLLRSPSGWHNDAWQRPSRHDQIQQDLLTFLRTRPLAGVPAGVAVARLVEGEYPILRGGQIIAYCDAIEILTVNLFASVSIFEVKPDVGAPFAALRQCKALLQLAKECVQADTHTLHLVVPHDAIGIATLRENWPHVWAWGAKFDAQSDSLP